MFLEKLFDLYRSGSKLAAGLGKSRKLRGTRTAGFIGETINAYTGLGRKTLEKISTLET
jgi:hypothetical protein